MSDIAIKLENISKQYRLGVVGTQTLRGDLQRFWWRVRGKEDPILKIGQENSLAKAGGDYVWALKDINLEVKQGEILGIIGKNGAGKSTLLKLLSQVTGPTTGSIKVNGRIASLLEVGTGFHPELTGKENIFLNGAILGMTKNDIKLKLDEIVEFAGVAKYLNTPVKRYSSGMYVRLAFAVAAHLEPDILVVDEVLAVGDAEFQKKAIGKMQDVSRGGGRTVLFVSHNMGSIKQLCTRGLVLNNGQSVFRGIAKDTVDFYINNSVNELTLHKSCDEDVTLINENIKINSIKLSPSKGNKITIESGIDFYLEFVNYRRNINIDITFYILSLDDQIIFQSGVILSNKNNSKRGLFNFNGKLEPFILNANIYKLKIVFGQNQMYVLYKNDSILQFEVEETFFNRGTNFSKVTGICRPNLNWHYDFKNL